MTGSVIQNEAAHQRRVRVSAMSHLHDFHHVQIDLLVFASNGQHRVHDNGCQSVRHFVVHWKWKAQASQNFWKNPKPIDQSINQSIDQSIKQSIHPSNPLTKCSIPKNDTDDTDSSSLIMIPRMCLIQILTFSAKRSARHFQENIAVAVDFHRDFVQNLQCLCPGSIETLCDQSWMKALRKVTNFSCPRAIVKHYIDEKISLRKKMQLTSVIWTYACFSNSPIKSTIDVVPSPVTSSCAVEALAIKEAVGCLTCCNNKKPNQHISQSINRSIDRSTLCSFSKAKVW